MSKQPSTVQTTQNSSTQVAPYVSEAQQNLLSYGKSLTDPFLSLNPNYRVAGFNPDQTQAFELGRQIAQSASTNPSYAPANGTTASSLLTSAVAGLPANPLSGITGMAPTAASTYAATPTMASGYDPSTYDAATATAARLDPSAITEFINPYIDNVIDPALRRMRSQYGETQAGIGARAAAAGAFGGSREAIERGQADRAYGDQVASTVGGLLSQGYNTAAGLAQNNASLEQQARLANAGYLNSAASTNAAARNNAGQFGASAQNAANATNAAAQTAASAYGAQAQNARDQYNASQGLSAATTSAQLANQRAQMQITAAQALEALRSNDQTRQQQALQTLLALGNQQQGLAQNVLNLPYSTLAQLAQITPNQYPTTTNTVGTAPNTAPGIGQQLLGAGLTIAGMSPTSLLGGLLCDARLKREIQPFGRDAKGRAIFTFRYAWDNDNDPVRVGPMAQIEELRDPDSVVSVLGFKMVVGA